MNNTLKLKIMKKMKYWMLSILAVAVLFTTSCDKTVDEAQLLVEYLESIDSPIDVEAIPAYIPATELKTLVATDGAYIIDIRSATDFTGIGHIEGAHNVPAGEVLTHLETADVGSKQIVITCYTGQSAAFVTSLVRMAGYQAKSLLWGMSSWNAACASSLNSNSKNTYEIQFTTDVTEKAEEGSLPVITTSMETAEEILNARIDEVLSAGFGAIAIDAATVFGALDNYYIVNYWPENHYALGHIPGAIQYTPNVDILSTEALKTLPTDKEVVIYCYTGQTSAFLAAYLKVLGYDALTLTFGVNGMATDWAASNGLSHWTTDHIQGYDLVTE